MHYAMYLDTILRIFCAHYFEFIFKSLPAWGNKQFGMYAQTMTMYLQVFHYRGFDKWILRLWNVLNIFNILNLHSERNFPYKSLFFIFHVVVPVVLLFYKQLAEKPIVAS